MRVPLCWRESLVDEQRVQVVYEAVGYLLLDRISGVENSDILDLIPRTAFANCLLGWLQQLW